MRRILIGTFALIMAIPAYAANDKTTTSVSYVGTALDAKQAKIPAANSAGAVAGSSVMTYTATSGTTGERALFTGGEYNASTDADKMITASALNSAITSLQTDTTSKLVCQNSPDCTLWIITDQTAYGVSGNGTTTVDLTALIGDAQGIGYAYISNDGRNKTTPSLGLTQNGAFVVRFGDGKNVRGKAQCSTQSGTGAWGQTNSPSEVTTRSTLPNSSGKYCWCKLDGYTTTDADASAMESLSSPWVYENYDDNASYCAYRCAENCARILLYNQSSYSHVFRAAMFNAVQ